MATTGSGFLLDRDGLDRLIALLKADGRRVIGPVARDGAICYDDVGSCADLPEGWTDRQEAGHYRLERRADRALFGYAVGPHSWKQFLHPPRVTEWRAHRTANGFAVTPEAGERPRFAFLGVRACEIEAIAIQDRVFLGDVTNSDYARRREDLFVVGVNCGAPAATCFCASLGTGPGLRRGFDLALTEFGEQAFLLEDGSPAGARLAAALGARPAGAAERDAARRVTADAARAMTRSLPVEGLKEALQSTPAHPRWDEVATRCLACGNCTTVCPTCFCTTVEDVTDLSGQASERVSRWDSCFNAEFSYIHGGPVRTTTRARYRQWLTHKLAGWIDQFGTSGCVGCGRCIAWCPVGIDITAEARALRTPPVAPTPAE